MRAVIQRVSSASVTVCKGYRRRTFSSIAIYTLCRYKKAVIDQASQKQQIQTMQMSFMNILLRNAQKKELI